MFQLDPGHCFRQIDKLTFEIQAFSPFKPNCMKSEIFSPEIQNVIKETLIAASKPSAKVVLVDGVEKIVDYPFPSTVDWRDKWIYFLMTDRFNNPNAAPQETWDEQCFVRQGGTFKGIQSRLGYLSSLGIGALWMTPGVKNWHPDNYHGYGIQDFLTIDGHFASDGTSATAERELIELIEEAHARGINVIFDIVLNHAGRVFDYVGSENTPCLPIETLYGPLGQELLIKWCKGYSNPLQYLEGPLPARDELSRNDAVWPNDLQRDDFFRRLGAVRNDHYPERTEDYPFGKADLNYFVKGDFGDNRQLVAEYEVKSDGSGELRDKYGTLPVLSILVQIHQYLIAKFDVDGFRIDTVKFVRPDIIQQFGNAIREFALSIGKRNFFMFGEIWDSEKAISAFTGRNGNATEGFGIDAALDYPLFNKLTAAAKSLEGGEVENIRNVFKMRKEQEENLLSSHGEASRYFVTFLDNHDQKARFNHPLARQEQITLGLSALFCLQGIPCLYYGTEQGLDGTKKSEAGNRLPDLGDNPESVREALWGKDPAFDPDHLLYRLIQELAQLRKNEPALRYGRQYFREVSADGHGFSQSRGRGGILAFSRILNNREILFVANTNPDPQANPFTGFVLVDPDLNPEMTKRRLGFCNQPYEGMRNIGVVKRDSVSFYDDNNELTGKGPATVLPIVLRPMEVQIFTPEFQLVTPEPFFSKTEAESFVPQKKAGERLPSPELQHE